MKKIALAMAATFVVAAAPSFAQNPFDELKKLQPNQKPTVQAQVDRSMSDLLDNGWSIVSASMREFLLTNRSGKWIECTLNNPHEFGQPPASTCMALN